MAVIKSPPPVQVPVANVVIGPLNTGPAPVNAKVADIPTPKVTIVPISQIDRSPGAVPVANVKPTFILPVSAPNVGVPIVSPVISIPASIITAPGNVTVTVSGNTIIVSTRPGGNSGAIQFNNGGYFGGDPGLTYNRGGLFVGGIGNPDANALGIISATSELRVGIWTYNGSLNGDKWGRIRMGQDDRFRNIEYYGFIGDPSINPRAGTAPRTLVISNEELEVKQAMVLMDGLVYDNSVANSEGTIFGISGLNSPANTYQPTTGLEPGWAKLIDVTNKGNVKIGGSLRITPSFQSTPPGNSQVGIWFADGTFQYTAAGSSLTIKDEGANVVTNTTTLNFVGAGVTASNVGGVGTITIPGGGSGITVQDEGSNVVNTTSTVNFVGSGVTASNVSGIATITISSGGISGITVQDEASNVVASATTVNFAGAGVTASNVAGVATITIPGGGSGITVQDEGSNIVNTASTVNFVGSGVAATNVGGIATITISSGGISGIAIQDEASNVVASATTVNFVGAGVTASNVAGVATVTIPGGGSGITVQDEGSNVVDTASTVNFIGSGVTASNVGGVATITITSSGTSGIAVQEEGSNVVASANTINFVGSTVTASNVSGVATITVASGDTVYSKGSVSGATTININDGTIQLCTLTGNTVFDISSVTVGKSLTLVLTQGAGGNHFATYGNTVYWAVGYKTLSTTAGAIDMVNLVNLDYAFAATLTTGYAT